MTAKVSGQVERASRICPSVGKTFFPSVLKPRERKISTHSGSLKEIPERLRMAMEA